MDERLRATLTDLCNMVERVGTSAGDASLVLRATNLRELLQRDQREHDVWSAFARRGFGRA